MNSTQALETTLSIPQGVLILSGSAHWALPHEMSATLCGNQYAA